MNRHRHWLIAGAALAALWTTVALVMRATDDRVAWPEKVAALLEATPWQKPGDGAPAARERHLGLVIANFNRLDDAQRRRLREDHQDALDRFFASLTPEEQALYVQRTVERHFDLVSTVIRRMSPDERKRLAGRLRSDLRNLRGAQAEGARLSSQDQEMLDFMIGEDPVLFLRGLPPRAKMELAPLIEEMQSRAQGLRR